MILLRYLDANCLVKLVVRENGSNELRTPATLNAFVREIVSDKVSLICTDEHSGYRGLRPDYPHGVRRHSTGSYVPGSIHTNTIEGFWSIFKRAIVGTFHKVSKRYLPLYVAEFEFRYNNRRNDNIFRTAISAC
jgi:ISXO2-like transposase domain